MTNDQVVNLAVRFLYCLGVGFMIAASLLQFMSAMVRR